MRLRFSLLPFASSDVSEATLSRLTPATTPDALLIDPLLLWPDPPGVCGGVTRGKAPEPAAVIEGTLLIEGVGLFMAGGAFWSGGWAKLAALDADMLRAGDAGRAGCEKGEGDGAGGGAIVPLFD